MSSLRVSEIEQPPATVTADLFRSVFRDHAASVVVVTAAGSTAPAGFTATSLASVSLEPPMVSFAVARSASAWSTVSRSPRLAVHLLAHDQESLATTFAASGIDRFEHVRWRTAPGGEPLIDGCAAYLCCEVVQHVPAGDHVLVVARVATARVERPGSPLIYHDGAYSSVSRVRDASPTPIRRRVAR